MKAIPILALGWCGVLVSPATAQEARMRIVTPATTNWGPAPPAFPKGAEIAVISGDPSKPGPFAFRVRAPAGYRVPLHTHPTAENMTVISGGMLHGMSANKAAAVPVHAGDFVYLPPHMAHAIWSDRGPAVVQINGTGPFDITYVDPRDDPRKQSHRR